MPEHNALADHRNVYCGAYAYDELIARDKASLDIVWLKNKPLEASGNLPDPDVTAQEIVEDLVLHRGHQRAARDLEEDAATLAIGRQRHDVVLARDAEDDLVEEPVEVVDLLDVGAQRGDVVGAERLRPVVAERRRGQRLVLGFRRRDRRALAGERVMPRERREDLATALRPVTARTLLIAFSSDWLYPPSGSEEIAAALRALGKDVELHMIDAPYGHDCFLLEEARQTPMIQRFLARQAIGDPV